MNAKILSILLTVIAVSAVQTEARGLRAPVITDENAVPAKGDIPNPKKFQPAIDAYMLNINATALQLENQIQGMLESLKKGDIRTAQTAYIKSHSLYERIRPIAELFGQVDQALNSRADYYEDREQNPAFVGFHLVEYDLFVLKDTDKAEKDGEDLLYGIRDLKKRLAHETILIPKMVQASADFMEMILDPKLLGAENLYSQSDLADIQADIEGSELIVSYLKPFISSASLHDIEGRFRRIRGVLARYRLADGSFRPFPSLTESDKGMLYSLVTDQAEKLATLRAELKIDVYYKYPDGN